MSKSDLLERQRMGAVIFAKDLPRMADFYAALLPAQIVQQEPDHIVLQNAHCELVIHGMPDDIAAQITIQTPPVARSETPLKLVFPHASIALARQQAVSLGGAILPLEAQWRWRSFLVCDGIDPEGNVLQLRESLAD